MENNNKGKMSKLESACYIIAMFFAVCAVFMTWASLSYIIASMSSYGMTFADIWSDVVQYVISGFVPYFAYAVLVFCAGKIIGLLSEKCEEKCQCNEAAKEDCEDQE